MHLDYSLILFCLTVASGSIWLADAAVAHRARRAGAAASPHARGPRGKNATDATMRSGPGSGSGGKRVRQGWIELAIGFFPVLLAVFLLRSFVFEPFRIPSGSMLPTLDVGDFIIVNKFAYGLRLPIVDREILPIGSPRRGDIVVFRYPLDPSEDYVKRVIGLPGDTIVYRDKRLTIDGRPIALTGGVRSLDGATERLHETLPRGDGTLVHDLLLDTHRAADNRPMVRFPYFGQCRYSNGADATVTCTVPAGHYFVMGDNRDDSADSRYWGFVPDRNLVGRALFVWMNFSHPQRIGGVH